MTRMKSKEPRATNWHSIMVLWAIMLILFVPLSLFMPNVPVLWLHWVSDMVPSARYMMSVSSFPYVTSTVYSLMWCFIPGVILFYFPRLHFTSHSIKVFREKKLIYFILFSLLLPVVTVSTFFLPDNESVGFTGDINKLISESRLFLGFFGCAFTLVIPSFVVGIFKWFVLMPKIFFNK